MKIQTANLIFMSTVRNSLMVDLNPDTKFQILASQDISRTGNSKEAIGGTLFPKLSRLNCVFGTILYQICLIPAKSELFRAPQFRGAVK